MVLHPNGSLEGAHDPRADGGAAALRGPAKLFLKANLKVEPTGALAVAAVMSHPERFMTGGLVCCVVSGGNVDPGVYTDILMGN